MNLIKRFQSIFRLAQAYRVYLIIAIICTIGASLTSLLPVFIIAYIGAELISGTMSSEILFTYAAYACAALLMRYVLLGISKALFHYVAFVTMYDLQIKLANKIGRVPLGTVMEQGSSNLKKVILQDTDVLHTIIGHYIEDFITGIVTPAACLIAFFYVDWQMGLVATAMLLPVYWGHIQGFKDFDKEAEDYYRADQHMQASFNEYVGGIAAIKIFNRDLSQKLVNATGAYLECILAWTRRTMFGWAAFNTFAESTLLIILPAGLLMVLTGLITPEVFLFFLLLGASYLQPFVRLASQLGFLSFAGKSVENIEAVLGLEDMRQPQTKAQPRDATVDVRDVDFYYDDKLALSNVSFSVRQGETCAFVGPSGAGKSTMAQLIGRFWDVKAGSIKIGGVDLRDLSEEILYQNVAFVFQDVFLFNDTILENLRMANSHASEAQVIEACKAARAHEFIMQLSGGYQSMVGEKGALLSGGQKQRLSIARAILRDAPILILDEATSYADPINEAEIQQALRSLMKGRTVIMIAHRLNTVMNADQIIVFDRGAVAGLGRHSDLLQNCRLYQDMWHDYDPDLKDTERMLPRKEAA